MHPQLLTLLNTRFSDMLAELLQKLLFSGEISYERDFRTEKSSETL